jgi:CelD/BcsL family acetyltransferase involved in cellulose biosynthesis
MVFHHPAWAETLSACYGFPSSVLVVTGADGAIAGGAPVLEVRRPLGPRRWVSLPFTDSCPPLADAEAMPVLVEALRTRAGRSELRGPVPDGKVVAAGVRHVLSLSPDPEELLRRLSPMHRRNIRRAESRLVTVQRGGSEQLETFYRLHLLTRRRLGVPVQPRRFFALLGERLLDRGLGHVLTAHVDGQPAASALFLEANRTIVYKYGASDPRFWDARPNNLLFWTAIRDAAGRGCHTMDFGRSDYGDAGLRRFKSGWGAQEEPLFYTVFGGDGGGPDEAGRGRAGAVLRAVIRRSPVWVCRMLGELLYRYAA